MDSARAIILATRVRLYARLTLFSCRHETIIGDAPPDASRADCLAPRRAARYVASMEFPHVTVDAKANIYFDGKVVSHSLTLADGSRKTLGLIFPGSYHFGTELAEVMEITQGACRVRLDGSAETRAVAAGGRFEVPAKSGFAIEVTEGICQYVCSFVR